MAGSGARAALLALVVAATSCGGTQRGARASGGDEGAAEPSFSCHGRRAEYMVVGGFAAAESGVSVVCDNDRPHVIKWQSESVGGQRQESNLKLSGEQFEGFWEKIDATGWRNVPEQCSASGPRKAKGKKKSAPSTPAEPIYTIDVSEGKMSKSFTCAGKELPFPYDRLVNELDLRANGFGDDAGGPL
jgi:hypothetical protein